MVLGRNKWKFLSIVGTRLSANRAPSGPRPTTLRNDYTSEFVSGGPKNYAYKQCNSVKGEAMRVCKMQRITLSYKASLIVNFNTIKELELNGRSNTTITVRTHKKFKRKRGWCVCIDIDRTRR